MFEALTPKIEVALRTARGFRTVYDFVNASPTLVLTNPNDIKMLFSDDGVEQRAQRSIERSRVDPRQ